MHFFTGILTNEVDGESSKLIYASRHSKFVLIGSGNLSALTPKS